MVADVGRDRIRDQVAQRPPAGGPRTQLARRHAQSRSVEERGPIGEAWQVLGQEIRASSRIAVAWRDHDARELEYAMGLAPAHETQEGLGRHDEHEVSTV